jgi:penicillin amidase
MSALQALLGAVLRPGLAALGRGRLPRIDGNITLPGLKAPIEILRDRWGVPHIFAGDLHDLFFAQGFVHAQDRFWQMELNRRTATGCLAEIFGPVALDTDRTTRTFGFDRLGRADWANAGDEVRAALQAYAEGVNAFLTSPTSRMPIEFTLLGHRPEPWRPEDSAAFARVMIWQLSHAWYGEILRARVIEAVGAEHAADLEIHYPSENPVALPQGIEFNRLQPDGSLIAGDGPFLTRAMGSNTWTVAGSRSTTGKPFLCNDMHLTLMLPAIWYLAHLRAGPFEVTGASLPGLPFVLVGHNARIAWGTTLAFTDAEDLFVEEFSADDSHQYRFRGQWRLAEVVPEAIRVKGRAEPHVENVLLTHHGPVISDVVGEPARRLAVCSMALRPASVMEGYRRLNLASGWDDFVEAMRCIDAPQLNMAYADVQGNTGYWMTGKVPVRASGDGTVPAPGWTGEQEWVGEVPFEEMPHALNPAEGVLVTSNHRVVGDDYPHFLGRIWMNGYRARRIQDVLSAPRPLGPDDFRRLHTDFTCIPGAELARLLSGMTTDDPDARVALDLLKKWDGILTTDSVGGAVYEVARYHLVLNLLEPGLGADLTLGIMGRGFHPLLMPAHEFYGHDTVALLRLLKEPECWWVRQAGGLESLLGRSLRQSVDWLRAHLGADSRGWQWGKMHRAIFPHAMGIQKPLDRVFNVGPLPIGGDTDTPCQTAIAPDDPYDNKAWAPTFRQIVDLEDFSRSMVMVPPGQSGQIGSPHYGDLAGPWARGEYLPMLWTREEIEREAEGRLTLTPSERRSAPSDQ